MSGKWIIDAIKNKENTIIKSADHCIKYEEDNIKAECNYFSEKTVVIIGGNVNAQEFLVTQFLKSGANVYFLINDISDGHRLARQLHKSERNNHVRPVCCNVANQVELQQRLEAINKLTGGIDILINNIVASDLDCRNESGGIDSHSVDYLQSTLSSAANVYPFMVTKNAGTIINVHSAMSQKEISKDTSCASVKGELTGITSGLASKMSSDNITVNSILLCLDKTVKRDSTDGIDVLNEIQGAYDIARLTVLLASDACCNMTGQVFIVGNHQ